MNGELRIHRNPLTHDIEAVELWVSEKICIQEYDPMWIDGELVDMCVYGYGALEFDNLYDTVEEALAEAHNQGVKNPSIKDVVASARS